MVVKIRHVYGLVYYQVISSSSKKVNITHHTSNGLVLLHAQGAIIALDIDWAVIIIDFKALLPKQVVSVCESISKVLSLESLTTLDMALALKNIVQTTDTVFCLGNLPIFQLPCNNPPFWQAKAGFPLLVLYF